MAHNVEIENTFRGPLDLLLYLVKRDEIDIHNIPIARLTRGYLEELAKMPLADVEAASDFLAIAAMLTEIKSRMLLPPVETEEADEAEEEMLDPRTGLVAKLREYLRFKEAAAALADLADAHGQRVARFPAPPDFPVADNDDPDGQTPGPEDDIRHAAEELLFAFQKFLLKARSTQADTIVYDEVPTERRMEQIWEVLSQIPATRFSRLLSDRPTTNEVVGFFLALLELIRQRKVRARQSADFSDIVLERRDAGERVATDWDREGGRARRYPLPGFLPVPERLLARAWRGAGRRAGYAAGGRETEIFPAAFARPPAPDDERIHTPAFRLARPERLDSARSLAAPPAPFPPPAARPWEKYSAPTLPARPTPQSTQPIPQTPSTPSTPSALSAQPPTPPPPPLTEREPLACPLPASVSESGSTFEDGFENVAAPETVPTSAADLAVTVTAAVYDAFHREAEPAEPPLDSTVASPEAVSSPEAAVSSKVEFLKPKIRSSRIPYRAGGFPPASSFGAKIAGRPLCRAASSRMALRTPPRFLSTRVAAPARPPKSTPRRIAPPPTFLK